MSQASSENLTPASLSPSTGSESASVQSLHTWTIPELRLNGIPYAATARKAELFWRLFPPTATAGPSAHQAFQLHSMVSSLSAAVSDVQTRVTALEVRPPTTFPVPVAVTVLVSPTTGTPESTSTVLPAHLVHASLRMSV